MEAAAGTSKLRDAIGARPAPPPRPSAPVEGHDDLRSSDSDSRSYSQDYSLKLEQPKVQAVILGGGFAGISLALALQKLSRVKVTLVDVHDRFVYTPSLTSLIADSRKPESVTAHYKDVMKSGKFIQSKILELTRRKVFLEAQELCFDYCFICTGLYYMVPGVSARAKVDSASSEAGTGSTSSGIMDLRKSPRKKRATISNASRNPSFTISQRFKAIFGDPVIGPLFHSFVAHKADFQREHRALLFLLEINRFEAMLGSGEKRSSSSSASSSSSVPRSARKHFTSVVQQFVLPGAPLEVKFVLSGKDSVKEQLIALEPKSVEPTVFKSTRRAILSLLAESALEAFFEAGSSLTAQSVQSSANTIITSSNSDPSVGSGTTSVSSSSHTSQPSPTGYAEPKSRRTRSATNLTATSQINNRSSSESSSRAPVLPSPVPALSNLQTAPKTVPSVSPPGTPSTSSMTSPTKPTNRLVMEIHETQYSNDHPNSEIAASITSSLTSSVGSNGATSPASPRAPIPTSTPVTQTPISLVNHKYPTLLPPMRTIEPLSVKTMMSAEELESIKNANRLVVVGGDLVAIELAAALHTRYPTKTITIVHSHRHLLMSMGENVRLIVDTFFKNRNIDVHRKKHVVTVQPFKMAPNVPDVYHLLLEDGSTLEADKVFCCNMDYQHGNTTFLEKHFSEYLDGRGFAKVDQFMRFANADNLFALGDVASLNEYKLAERARAHASLVSANLHKLLHALEMDPYRERATPKTFDLVLTPQKGVQIENGRFVRIGPGPVERRDYAERRILHRFGAVSLVLNKNWQVRPNSKNSGNNKDDETAGSRGETSSDTPTVRSKRESRKLPLRRLSDNAAEEDSDEARGREGN